MGRKRKTDRHLPPRVYLRHGAYYYVTQDGKWLKLSRDYLEAKRKWAELGEEPIVMTTMGHVMDRYMAEIAPQKAPATYRDNQREIRPLRIFFGDMLPEDVRPRHIYQYLDERSRSARVRANRERALLSHIFGYAIRWGVVEHNPCREVRRLPERPRDRYITDEEFLAVRSVASPVVQIVMDLAYLTAMRRADLLHLRLDAVRAGDGIYVQQEKTKKRMVFDWTPELAQVVERAKSLPRPVRSVYLVCNRRGQPYTDNGFNALWQRVVRRALDRGVLAERFHFHDIRAKALTDARRQGLNAQLLAGHKTAKQTEDYIRDRTHERVIPLRGLTRKER